jgi:hypothetical protein
MDTIAYLLPIVAVLAVVIVVWATRRKPWSPLPYTKRPSLLTAGELRFHRVLVQVIPPGMTLFVKVRLMDLVVSVPDEHWRQYGAPASWMQVELVLVDPATTDESGKVLA